MALLWGAATVSRPAAVRTGMNKLDYAPCSLLWFWMAKIPYPVMYIYDLQMSGIVLRTVRTSLRTH